MLAKAVDQQLDRIQIQGKKGSHEFLIVPLVAGTTASWRRDRL
jgi:hypothetical protein